MASGAVSFFASVLQAANIMPKPEQSEANKGLEPQRERLPGAGGRLIAARRPLSPPRNAHAWQQSREQQNGRLESHE